MCRIWVVLLFCTLGGVLCKHSSLAVNRHVSEAKELHEIKTSESKKLSIDLYYESLCPFCRQLFTKGLKPLLEDKDLSQQIDLHLYPFGNAQLMPTEQVSDGWKFWHPDDMGQGYEYVVKCQHGADECFGNKIQACALKLNTRETANAFITCMESSNFGLELASHSCAQNLTVDLDPIRKCVQGKDGNAALTEMGIYTQNLSEPAGPHKYVPWVVIDGKHDDDAELDGDEGYSGFLLQQVCAQLEIPKPTACSNIKLEMPAGTEEMKQVKAQRLQAQRRLSSIPGVTLRNSPW